MTRETKIGLVIAGSFLCLVCIVVVSKLQRGDVTPTEPEESTVPMAANHSRDAKKGHEVPVRSEVIHPKNPTTPPATGGKNSDTDPKKSGVNHLPTHTIIAPAHAEDQTLKELERQKALASGNQAQQMPAGKTIDTQAKTVTSTPVQLPGLAPEKKGPEGDYVFVPPPVLPAFPPSKEEKPSNTGVNSGSIPAPTSVAAPMLIAPPVPTTTASTPDAFAPGVAVPGVAEPTAGVKKDSFGAVGPFPSPFETSKVSNPASAAEPFPALPLKKDHDISLPSLNAGATTPGNSSKVDQNIPAPPNSGAFGQGNLQDNKANSLPALNQPKENSVETPRPGFPGGFPPLNGPPQQYVTEAPKTDFALPPSPQSNPPTIPALGKSNDPPRENAPFPATISPLVPEPKSNPIPTIAGKDVPSLPTITTSPAEGTNPIPTLPPIRIGGNKVTSVVQQTDTAYYVCQPGETNFAAVSRRLYGSDKYGDALFAYNRDHRLGLPSGSNVTANLNPGQPVLNPPRGLLERDYRSLIRDLEPNPIAPVVSTAPPVKLATPSPLMTAPQATRVAVIPGQNTPGTNALVPNPSVPSGPMTDKTQSYVVQNPRGESILDVSERILGDRSRWHEIYRINPSYRPELTIPAGTSLRVPVQ